jgi:hypothetical protein
LSRKVTLGIAEGWIRMIEQTADNMVRSVRGVYFVSLLPKPFLNCRRHSPLSKLLDFARLDRSFRVGWKHDSITHKITCETQT